MNYRYAIYFPYMIAIKICHLPLSLPLSYLYVSQREGLLSVRCMQTNFHLLGGSGVGDGSCGIYSAIAFTEKYIVSCVAFGAHLASFPVCASINNNSSQIKYMQAMGTAIRHTLCVRHKHDII